MEQERNNLSNMFVVKFENHKIPEFKEVRNRDWVYYGDNNLYPDYLIELSLRSAKHGAILNGKVNYIYGGGLQVVQQGSSLQAKAIANGFIKKLNEDNFIRRIIQDLEIFNGYYLEVIYKNNGKFDSINYIPFSKIRTNKEETEYYYSNDWSKEKQDEKTGLKTFKPFDINSKEKNQLFCFKILSPKNGKDKNVYPVPEYIGACASIETDVEIANYHLNNVKTGFSVGSVLNFNNGRPEEEAQKIIEKKVKEKFTGTDKAGALMITFNDAQDKAPTVTSFTPSDLDKQFIEISKRVEQDIFTGHKITNPALFGVNATGVVFQRSDLIDSFELFQNTYTNIRQLLIEDVLNKFASLNGVSAKIELKRTKAVQGVLPDATMQKIYDSYPIDQLIEIVGFPKRKTSQQVQMANEKNIETIFSKYGNIVDGVILKEIPLHDTTDFDFNKFENKILFEFKKELSANEKSIIDLLSKDSLTPTSAIAKALKISDSEVNKLISSLEKGGYLEINNDEITPTTIAENVISNEPAKTDLIEVRYKYNWRPDVKTHNLSHSREFCKERMAESKAGKTYASADLINMENDLGTNVWEFRGGWWNDDGANVPYCRHLWYAVVIKKNK